MKLEALITELRAMVKTDDPVAVFKNDTTEAYHLVVRIDMGQARSLLYEKYGNPTATKNGVWEGSSSKDADNWLLPDGIQLGLRSAAIIRSRNKDSDHPEEETPQLWVSWHDPKHTEEQTQRMLESGSP